MDRNDCHPRFLSVSWIMQIRRVQRAVSLSNCRGCLSCEGCLHNGEAPRRVMIRRARLGEGRGGGTAARGAVALGGFFWSSQRNLGTTLQGSPGWRKPWPYLWLELLFVTIKCTSVRARLFWVSPHHATGTHCLLRSSVGERWLGATLRESVTNSEIFPIFAYSRLFFFSFFLCPWLGREGGRWRDRTDGNFPKVH